MQILSIIEKLLLLIALISTGIILKKFKMLSDQSENDLSRLLINFFWPGLIFFSITGTLSAKDITQNWSLPVLGIVTSITGLLIGLIFLKIIKFEKDSGKIFLYNCTINNFVFLVLPFAESMLPHKGAGLLFLNNLGMIIIMWTVGMFIFTGFMNVKNSLKNVLSPGLIVTIIAMVLVLTGFNKLIPTIIKDLSDNIGKPTIIISMIVAGAQIYKLGVKAIKFDLWNISLGVIRLIIIPALLLFLSLFLKSKFGVSKDTLLIFMLVNIMPVSIVSVSFALKFNTAPECASQSVVFTHIFSILTIPFFIYIMQLVF
jgi:malate permease and related proteins